MDQQQPVSVGQNAPIISVENYSSFGLSVTASEVIITLGESRVLLSANADGSLGPIVVPQFSRAISLAPNVAVGLRHALEEALKVYESTFGSIPKDPSTSIVVGSPSVPNVSPQG